MSKVYVNLVEVVGRSEMAFPWSPVICEWSWKRTQIEKKYIFLNIYQCFDELTYSYPMTRTRTIEWHLMNLGFKIIFLRKIFNDIFKDLINLLNFLSRRKFRYICLITCERKYFIHLSYHISTPQIEETKWNGLPELQKFKKQIQGGDMSYGRILRSVKGF